MRRDFSRLTVAELYRTIESIKAENQWDIDDFFRDQTLTVPDLSDVRSYYRTVLDKYNIGEQELDTILDTVAAVDASYELALIGYANAVDELAQRIRNLADLISPSAISLSPTVFADLGHRINNHFNEARQVADGLADEETGATDQILDEQQPWWEKLANGAGGLAYGVFDSVVLGGAQEFGEAIDSVFGTQYGDVYEHSRKLMEGFVVGNWVGNEQWFFGGKAVGDGAAIVGGAASAVFGIATIVGSVTIGAGGVAASLTGVGAAVGAPAIAVSGAGVAAGVGLIGVGAAMVAGGSENVGRDWAASAQAGVRASEPSPYSGSLSWKRDGKRDLDAEALAKKLGGEYRVYFRNDPKKTEIDVITDEWICECKGDLGSIGEDFRTQAKVRFQMAKESGRGVYYHFNSEPAGDIKRALERYAERYGVKLVIDVGPL